MSYYGGPQPPTPGEQFLNLLRQVLGGIQTGVSGIMGPANVAQMQQQQMGQPGYEAFRLGGVFPGAQPAMPAMRPPAAPVSTTGYTGPSTPAMRNAAAAANARIAGAPPGRALGWYRNMADRRLRPVTPARRPVARRGPATTGRTTRNTREGY